MTSAPRVEGGLAASGRAWTAGGVTAAGGGSPAPLTYPIHLAVAQVGEVAPPQSLVASLRSVGVAAVVSGAGPTVLALGPVPADFRPGAAWRAESLGVDSGGALVKGSMVEHAERGPVAAGRKS